MKNKINSLTNLIKAYGNQKTDMEIAHMLDIPLEKVKSERKKVDIQEAK